MPDQSKPAVLLLEDGFTMKGVSFGIIGTTSGEVCFNTGMTGYQEVFTDPSYTGQVLIMNNVHTGNYGVRNEDTESDEVRIKGLIGRNLEKYFSRPLGTDSLQNYLEQHQIVGISGVDTRALVAHIRTKGAMNCIISSEILDVKELKAKLDLVPSMAGLELASVASTDHAFEMGDPDAKVRIAVLDFGVKRNILNCMVERGAFLKVFPAKTSVAELNEFNPSGYFLSNGPGDPASMDYAIKTVKGLMEEHKPLFGICLGHQLLALANGIPTFKMNNGHRGLNHPVKNLVTGICEITTQNHGFGVNPDAIKNSNHVEITHVNLNDGSIEGIKIKDKPAFSVQYHPESTPGPHDSRYLFDQFIAMMN